MRVWSSVKYACLPRSATQEGISVSGTEGVLSLALDRVALHLGDKDLCGLALQRCPFTASDATPAQPENGDGDRKRGGCPGGLRKAR